MKMYINKLKWLFVRDIPLGRLPVQKTGWKGGEEILSFRNCRVSSFSFPLLPAFSKIIDLVYYEQQRDTVYVIFDT